MRRTQPVGWGLTWAMVGCAALLLTASPGMGRTPHPNLLYILADDLGYGDVACLNPSGKIPTPNLDRLAREGMTFTDAHSGSSVCTPTRYGILTGRYAWRSRLKSGVLGGLSPRLIEPGRPTVASFLRENGYRTACFGKWHLGMDWALRPGKEVAPLSIETREQVFNVDYSRPIANGPTSVGFDEFFGISASLDMVPYTYIRNDRVTELPTEDRDFPMVLGRTTGRTRKGPAAPGFDAGNVLPDLAAQARRFIRTHGPGAREGKPFFLYLPLASPHTPILPSPEWRGRSGLNAYADFVMETDARVGEVLAELEASGLARSTLVIFTSDNGCSPQADIPALQAAGHRPSGVYRGHKADIFEGGHRIPFLVRWPGVIRPGSRSERLICLTDLFATSADLLDRPLPAGAAEDSVSLLPALRGRRSGASRSSVVHHSINGSLAIRQGKWKLALCADSGGWSDPRPGSPAARELPAEQLYDLIDDPGESRNLIARHPDTAARLRRLLEESRSRGRSR